MLRGLVLGMKAHHECRAQQKAGLVESTDHLFSIGNGEAERLFAEHVLSGTRAGDGLLAMQPGGRGNVDYVEIALEKMVDASSRAGFEFRGDLAVRALVDIENGDQFGISGWLDSFRNGPAPGDTA